MQIPVSMFYSVDALGEDRAIAIASLNESLSSVPTESILEESIRHLGLEFG